MRQTYINTADSNTVGVLGNPGQDVRLFKLLIGNPADGDVLTVFNSSVAYAAQTENIAFKLTQPTAAAGKDWVREVDFGPEGLPLDGGNVIVDATMQVTAIWDLAPEG